MRLLLDTHSFLWFANDDPKLSTVAKALIVDPSNEVHVSPASFWEIAIKVSLCKYNLKSPFDTFMHQAIDGNDFEILPFEVAHAAVLSKLPFHHKDPFDRMLAAQAMAEQIPLLSSDGAFDLYPVVRLW